MDSYVVRIEEGDAGQTDPEERAILAALHSACTPDWCVPAVELVVGQYATATLRCTQAVCENAKAYLMRQGGTWVVIDYGTGITEEDLIESVASS
ncbi:MAG: hypothetical protein EOM91_20255 [Sphingobacteriia bacterium]|nr:hypothetical protein [Sphingobacteriia bacterium]NCC41572.1 hypothetical protein [Gammaproteobacteria bacterium]